jgi:hypothetical protein
MVPGLLSGRYVICWTDFSGGDMILVLAPGPGFVLTRVVLGPRSSRVVFAAGWEAPTCCRGLSSWRGKGSAGAVRLPGVTTRSGGVRAWVWPDVAVPSRTGPGNVIVAGRACRPAAFSGHGWLPRGGQGGR